MGACSQPAPVTPPPPKVDVAQPVARDVIDFDEYTARLDAVESVEVRPRVSGYLQSISFRDGAVVNKGDLLFTIDQRPYVAALRHAEADLASAKARLDLAHKNMARSVDLIRSHAISQEEADIRESNVRQAEAAVEESQAAIDAAKLDVEFTQITAPIRGRIGRKLVTEGNLINGGVGTQGTLLTTIVSLDPIYAYAEADERSYLKYVRLAQSGQRPSARYFRTPVWIGLADEDGFPHEGTMDFVDNQLDRGTGTIIGRALLPNPDLLLSPGMFARMRLPGSGQYHALLLPDEAVGTDQSQKFVYVVDNANKAQYRTVETGPLVDGLRVVRGGLSPEEWVIVNGVQRARTGITVDPQRLSQLPTKPGAAEKNRTAIDTAAKPSDAKQ
ncbi:MAG TPA: efflux RND transporter periplasmic adaptor subunit [Candidatus Acidoferrales bacterium]|nr:efflux RND transporter periplasmic adaptor subunit [Candidatus Acidoferrales bacterium]